MASVATISFNTMAIIGGACLQELGYMEKVTNNSDLIQSKQGNKQSTWHSSRPQLPKWHHD